MGNKGQGGKICVVNVSVVCPDPQNFAGSGSAPFSRIRQPSSGKGSGCDLVLWTTWTHFFSIQLLGALYKYEFRQNENTSPAPTPVRLNRDEGVLIIKPHPNGKKRAWDRILSTGQKPCLRPLSPDIFPPNAIRQYFLIEHFYIFTSYL